MLRSTLRIVAVLIMCAASSSISNAHGYLVRSFPGAKSSLIRSPHHVELLFSLKADPNYSMVRIEDDLGNVLATKAQDKRSRRFTMDAPALEPGRYRVVYRMLAPDGDLIQGKVDFAIEE